MVLDLVVSCDIGQKNILRYRTVLFKTLTSEILIILDGQFGVQRTSVLSF